MLRAVGGGHFIAGKFGLKGVWAGGGGELSGGGADGDSHGLGPWEGDPDDLRVVMFSFLHEIGPDREGDPSAVGLTADSGGIVQPDPDAAGKIGVETDEPSVLEIIGGAGFSSDGSFETVGFDAGGGASGLHDFLEHIGHEVGSSGGDDLVGDASAAEDNFARGIFNMINEVGSATLSGVGKDAHGTGEAFEGGAQISDINLGAAALDFLDASGVREREDAVHGGAFSDAHGHGIAAFDEPKFEELDAGETTI